MKNKVPIIFIGFMGTGKTTIGQYLSELQNLSYVDLDQYIELNEEKSIQIFSMTKASMNFAN